MTTINNLTIEQMREIVDGAPEGSTFFLYDTYFKSKNPVEWYYWEESQWKFTSYETRFENLLISIDDLRTAIAEYDSREFKLDDLIVFRHGDNTEILKVQYVWDDAVWGGYCGEIYKNNEVRHATPSEIKAGHRIDDTTDHVTDIGEEIDSFLDAFKSPELTDERKEELTQDWNGMSGVVAFSLIERHADNWKEIDYMMNQWLEANREAERHG